MRAGAPGGLELLGDDAHEQLAGRERGTAEGDDHGVVWTTRRDGLAGAEVLAPVDEVRRGPDGVGQATAIAALVSELAAGLDELGGDRVDRGAVVRDEAEGKFLKVGDAVVVEVEALAAGGEAVGAMPLGIGRRYSCPGRGQPGSNDAKN